MSYVTIVCSYRVPIMTHFISNTAYIIVYIIMNKIYSIFLAVYDRFLVMFPLGAIFFFLQAVRLFIGL